MRTRGAEATLMAVLAAIAVGTVGRAAGSTVTLLAGTGCAAAAIAVGNVALPVLIKTRFPARAGLLIGLYTAALSLGAALAGGVTVPLSRELGWQAALAFWALPALAPLLLLARTRRRPSPAGTARGAGMRALLSDRLAWSVTLFFGLQAAIVFSGLSWLPSILDSDGYSASASGALLAVYALGGVPAALAVSVLAARLGGQRALARGLRGARGRRSGRPAAPGGGAGERGRVRARPGRLLQPGRVADRAAQQRPRA